MRLILASASPRRAELLRRAGFDFETRAADVDETVRVNEPPQEYVRRLAMEKSARVMQVIDRGPAEAGHYVRLSEVEGSRTDGVVVLGADTVVVVDGEILGKPRDDAHAAKMLRRLSGRQHEVITGVSLRASTIEVGRAERTTVEFSRLSDADVTWYVASGEGRDKAGAYAIQGLASRFIPRIVGSYSSVVGLPLATVWELLDQIASAGHSGYSQR